MSATIIAFPSLARPSRNVAREPAPTCSRRRPDDLVMDHADKEPGEWQASEEAGDKPPPA